MHGGQLAARVLAASPPSAVGGGALVPSGRECAGGGGLAAAPSGLAVAGGGVFRPVAGALGGGVVVAGCAARSPST
ncbi:MAG: hypothetical protein ACJ77M_16400, partial [Thermoleophilaceae bacterium]